LKIMIMALMVFAYSNRVHAADRALLKGSLIPGSLITGKVAPGSKINFHKKTVRVSPDGTFILGFGRNAKLTQSIEILDPNGFTYTQNIKLKKRTYNITRIDGLPGRKVTPNPKDVKRIKANNAGIVRVRQLDTKTQNFLNGFQWPILGRISGVYGSQRVLNGKPRSPHNGVDIAAPKGSTVLATAKGTIALVHQDMFYSGKTVMIDHGHGLSSIYIHMSEILVKQGQLVTKGEAIGAVGMTGRATGPHLHWGISLFRTHLDPMLIVTGKTNVKKAQ
jgi:murein DD-endopeptidase MepM/ murein hydrolase activator NlpD|tara:strand:+ start:3742 stop:4572 length:831 start_codon:yes stop_codon:yes gene_type:complete